LLRNARRRQERSYGKKKGGEDMTPIDRFRAD